jgi:hypothetical protein
VSCVTWPALKRAVRPSTMDSTRGTRTCVLIFSMVMCLIVLHIKWIYRGDDWLFVRRWEHLLAHRHKVDIVQVISWNGSPLSYPLMSGLLLRLGRFIQIMASRTTSDP